MTTLGKYAPLSRRILALLYDLLLVASLLVLASLLVVMVNGGESTDPNHPAKIAFFIGVVFVYFGYSWVNGGQTVGMKAWKIKLISEVSRRISWTQALVRFAFAMPLVGLIWSMFNAKHQGFHDTAANTVMIDLRD
jgi:uncharacterized RDD family membrane protein YckC